MFAVKGWAVSANSLQTQTKGPSSTDGRTTSEGNVGALTSKSKKRKHEKKQNKSVTAENLAELWTHHIEGNGAPVNNLNVDTKPLKKEKKRLKRDSDASKFAESLDGSNSLHTPPGKQKDKSRKQEMGQIKIRDARNPLNQQQNRKDKTTATETTESQPRVLEPSPPLVPVAKLTPLQSSMRQKLISSRFRYLNEALYTTHSKSSSELFKQNPTFFSEYHEGFRRQVTAWPENPVDGFIRWIRERGTAKGKDLGSQKAQFRKEGKAKGRAKHRSEIALDLTAETEGIDPLPRNPRTGLCTIADLGCGDAQLAEALTKSPPRPSIASSLKLQIHSYDLASTSPLVTVADISSVPLADGSVDVAIFSLALMGTNWIEFIEEAYRILRWKGECWISEVNSRFASPKKQRVEHSVGNRHREKEGRKSKRKGENGLIDEGADEDLDTVETAGAAQQAGTDVSAFVSILQRRGFVLQGEPELGNKMFVRMRFLKSAPAIVGKGAKDHQASGFKGKKFLEDGSHDQVSAEDEARALKPCVYKTR